MMNGFQIGGGVDTSSKYRRRAEARPAEEKGTPVAKTDPHNRVGAVVALRTRVRKLAGRTANRCH